MTEPTTTSYAILCLLAVQPWTTYELAQQMHRSIASVWPRVASVVYEEPKRLVAAGLATATKEYAGRRPRTVYRITPKGRRALRRWLDRPGAAPSLEFEALLKIAFADQGSLDGLRANLAAVRAYAEDQIQVGTERMREYAETGGPFPDRLPVILLVGRYFVEYAEMLHRWTIWAEAETASWQGT
jgi:PadR family transcriptional regulator, regulatory protein AphA